MDTTREDSSEGIPVDDSERSEVDEQHVNNDDDGGIEDTE
jgi:hypothetical protein